MVPCRGGFGDAAGHGLRRMRNGACPGVAPALCMRLSVQYTRGEQDDPRAVSMRAVRPPSGDRAAPAPAAWVERDAATREATLLAILARVTDEALEANSLEDTLQRVVDCLTTELPVTLASIILLNEEATEFTSEVWSGELNLELPGPLPWPVSLGVAGRCARTGVPQLVDDVHADPDYVPGNDRVASEYITPIRRHQRLHGVLNLESTDAGFFTPQVRAAFDVIAARIAGVVHLARAVHDLRHANAKLRDLSLTDALTGVANRRGLDVALAAARTRCTAAGEELSLLLLDIDCFKPLNDNEGHQRGDECLRRIATVCVTIVPPEATVARFGGDEFVIVLPGSGRQAALECGEHLCRVVRSVQLCCSDGPHGVTVSVGVSTLPPGVGSTQQLIEEADGALYAAKAAGRNCVRAFDPARDTGSNAA